MWSYLKLTVTTLYTLCHIRSCSCHIIFDNRSLFLFFNTRDNRHYSTQWYKIYIIPIIGLTITVSIDQSSSHPLFNYFVNFYLKITEGHVFVFVIVSEFNYENVLIWNIMTKSSYSFCQSCVLCYGYSLWVSTRKKGYSLWVSCIQIYMNKFPPLQIDCIINWVKFCTKVKPFFLMVTNYL